MAAELWPEEYTLDTQRSSARWPTDDGDLGLASHALSLDEAGVASFPVGSEYILYLHRRVRRWRRDHPYHTLSSTIKPETTGELSDPRSHKSNLPIPSILPPITRTALYEDLSGHVNSPLVRRPSRIEDHKARCFCFPQIGSIHHRSREAHSRDQLG
jgi:hypothetical protein